MPKKTEPSKRTNVYLRKTLLARLQIRFFDKDQARVPYGILSDIVNQLLEAYLNNLDNLDQLDKEENKKETF